MRKGVGWIQGDEVDVEFADVETRRGQEETDEDRKNDVVGLVEASEYDHADTKNHMDIEQEDKSYSGSLVVLFLRARDEEVEAVGADQ